MSSEIKQAVDRRLRELGIIDFFEREKEKPTFTSDEAAKLKRYTEDRAFTTYIQQLERVKERIKLVKTLDGLVGDLQEDISSAQSSIDSLDTDMTGLSDRISTASDRLDNVDSWIEDLKGRVSSAEGTISTLEDRAKGLRTDIEDAYSDIEDIDDKARTAIINARESLSAIKEKYIDKWSKTAANIIKQLGDNFKAKIQEFKALWKQRKAAINSEKEEIKTVFNRINNTRIPALQSHLNSIRDHIGSVSGADALDAATCKSRPTASTEEGAAGEMYAAAGELSRFITCLRGFCSSFTIDLKIGKISFPIPHPGKIPDMAASLGHTAENIYDSMKEIKKGFDNVQDLGGVLDSALSDIAEVSERSRRIVFLSINTIVDLGKKLSDIVGVSLPGAPSLEPQSKTGAAPSKKGLETPGAYEKRRVPVGKGYTSLWEFTDLGKLKTAKIIDPEGNVKTRIAPKETEEEETASGETTEEEITAEGPEVAPM